MATPNTSVHATTCTTCGGRGTVQVQIYNTATGQTQTITQTCLDCL
jgi:DnaJ-class molecular chaperone